MASNGKKKTTMAKLNRERRLQEKRLDKAARKERRKAEAANPTPENETEDWLSPLEDEDEVQAESPASPAPTASSPAASSPAASSPAAPAPASQS